MGVFHQMGHHSNNLIDLPEMSAYKGAIFSPINVSQSEAADQIGAVRQAKRNFEIIFDPQLYVPSTNRGKLKAWPYFPRDFDTADLGSAEWWTNLNRKLATTCKKLKIDTLCSPVAIPKAFDDKYYENSIRVASELIQMLNGSTAVLQTVLANLSELGYGNRALELASIVSGTGTDRVYLILMSTKFPRRELSETDELSGAMQFISALERNGLPVLVGFCSSDMLLWKAAGARDCASGKFFNLRRFTRQRFEEPAEGGGQLPYWFEEALLAFLRQADLVRVRRLGLLSAASERNPFGRDILGRFERSTQTRNQPSPWLALSWRHFLFWFADAEQRLASRVNTAEQLLTQADANWKKLDAAKTLMEERENDGTWIRAWLNAITDFTAPRA